MKILFISGEDYCALEFERAYKGKEIKTLIENFETIKREFLELRENASIELKELNIDKEAFIQLKNFFSDHDFLKDKNAYLETEII